MKVFLAGLGIGVGIGLLFAPESGEVSRRKIRAFLGECTKAVEERIDEAKRRFDSATVSSAPADREGTAFRKRDLPNEPVATTGGDSSNSSL